MQQEMERAPTAAEQAAARAEATRQDPTTRKRLIGAVLAAVVIGGAGLGIASLLGVTGKGAPADVMTQAAADARSSAWGAALADHKEGFKLEPVSPGERRAALATMGLPSGALAALERDLASGAVKLGWVSLRDDRMEDGDTVTVQSAGFHARVVLRSAPIRVAVPVAAAGGMVNVAGTYDGGGGITVEMQGQKLPALIVGQVVPVPVVVGP